MMSRAVKSLRLLKRQSELLYPSVRRKTTNREKNILKSPYEDIPKLNITINDFIWMNLDRWPDKTAAVCAVTGRGYTYSQIHKMTNTFAASLHTKLKLRVDDKVAIILPNGPEYPIVILGVLQAGCVASTMNPVYTAEELKRQLELIECKAVVTSKISHSNVKTALEALKLKIPVIITDNDNLPDGTLKFSEFVEDVNIDYDCLKSAQRSPDDIAILPFSSGTTGFPKAVVLTHRSVVAVNQMIAQPQIVAVPETTATFQSVFPCVLPFFHIFGFNALMLNQMHLGCKLVTLPYFKPELFLKTMVEHKATALFLVPPMLVFLGKHPAVKPEHLKSVLSIVSGAAPISKSDAEAVVVKNPNINFRQGYGLTETNGGAAIADNKDTNYAAVGHVFSKCEFKIAHFETQEALGPGQEGELWTRGPNLMEGYYKNKSATNEVLTDDGWYKTGDIGRYDDNGYIYVTDRLKELIKVKGFQVPPAELESVLRTHPKILDCAVIGLPDPRTGEAPKAFVVLHKDVKVKESDILNYVNEKVTNFKMVKEVQFVDEIPKNPAGKILRRVLKDKYC